MARRPLPEFKIIETSHVIVLRESTPHERTMWPWPFRADEDSPAWKARYQPDKLTRTDLFELASIADAYGTLITHPAHGVRQTMGELHRIFDAWNHHIVDVNGKPITEAA